MARITKAPEERRLEIVQTAERLFREVGYAKCSVEMIIQRIGIAKGTFYYYFKSKEAILEAIADQTLGQIVEYAKDIADNPSLSALAKFETLLTNSHVGNVDTQDISDILHLPENRELHELTNVKSVLQLSPIFAKIVSQGNQEGVFAADRPLARIQYVFVATQFLLDGGLFQFSDQEIRERREIAQELIEKTLGAAPGSFDFMNPTLES
ncbi:TetR/AcrR family transcriptional regulator [Shimia sp.]|uniref:TetR/AcrR family transcriptional regulator n=1 Tax=Shimia sp. TaxID=1954381 RepID=UPI003299314F